MKCSNKVEWKILPKKPKGLAKTPDPLLSGGVWVHKRLKLVVNIMSSSLSFALLSVEDQMAAKDSRVANIELKRDM